MLSNVISNFFRVANTSVVNEYPELESVFMFP